MEKVRNQLASWNSIQLSFGGRIVLLKSVLYALPIYFISFFKMLVGVINAIESLFRRFLWGGGSKEELKENKLGGMGQCM